MTLGIVDVLEIIQVKQHYDRRAVIGPHLIDDLLQTLPERETVGHPGQRIMIGIVLQTAVLHLKLFF